MHINHQQTNWLTLIADYEFAYNDTVSSVHGMSPFYVEHGVNPLSPIDLTPLGLPKRTGPMKAGAEEAGIHVDRIIANHSLAKESLKRTQENMREQADRRRRAIDELIKPGAKAWLSLDGINLPSQSGRPTTKLKPKYFGPYKVLSRITPVSFELAIPSFLNLSSNTFHVSRLKHFLDPSMEGMRSCNPEPVKDEEYEIDDIVNQRVTRGKQIEYLVRWKGYSLHDSTWEPASAFKNAKAVLTKWKKHVAAETDKEDQRLARHRR